MATCPKHRTSQIWRFGKAELFILLRTPLELTQTLRKGSHRPCFVKKGIPQDSWIDQAKAELITKHTKEQLNISVKW